MTETSSRSEPTAETAVSVATDELGLISGRVAWALGVPFAARGFAEWAVEEAILDEADRIRTRRLENR